MIGFARSLLIVLLALTWVAQPGFAQQPETTTIDDAEAAAAAANAAEQARTPERIDIGLSVETVPITSDFAGQSLTIFGAIDNIDPLIQRQGRYDIFVILQGPSANLVTRRKARVFGIWMNVDSQQFDGAPQSYLIASTRQPRDITSAEALQRHALGVSDIRLRPHADQPRRRDLDAFSDALLRLKQQDGLYREFAGGVQFISQSLFRAEMWLPANVPLGDHTARAYLFRNGELVAQTGAGLAIAKAGFEYAISDFARTQGLYYGLACVLMALIVGWLGRILFKRD